MVSRLYRDIVATSHLSERALERVGYSLKIFLLSTFDVNYVLCVSSDYFDDPTHGCEFVYFCGCSGTHNAEMGTQNSSLGTHKNYRGTHNGFTSWAPTIVLIIVK